MSAVDAVLAATLTKDYRASKVGAFDPLRDIPQLLGWWDFSTLTGTDGAAVRRVVDKSGLGQDLVQATSANQPTKQTGADGKPVLRVASGQFMQAVNLAAAWPIGSTVGPPVTILATVKTSSTQVDTFACIAGGITAGGQSRMIVQQATGCAFSSANAVASVIAGPQVADDSWHVLASAVDISGASQYVDGYLTGGQVTASTADGIKGFTVGAVNGTTNRFVGDIREVMVVAGRLRFDQIEKVSAWLAARASTSISTGKCQAGTGREDTTSSNGQGIAVWEPPSPAASKTIILWSHPASHNQFLSPSYWGYAYIHAALAQGWYFAASNMHADQWGNATAQADLLDLYNLVNGRYAPSNIILVGASMGGLPTALAVSSGLIPNTKGAYLIDAVLNLKAQYGNSTYTSSIATAYGLTSGTLSAAANVGDTSVSSSVSFASGTSILIDPQGANPELVTTTGSPTGTGPFTIPVPALGFAHSSGVIVSDYGTKTSGFDPMLKSASTYATRLRFLASSADTNVVKSSNTDAFRTLASGAATESALVTHLSTHLAGAACNPADLVAFVKRCGG